jgi:hypothetical protein
MSPAVKIALASVAVIAMVVIATEASADAPGEPETGPEPTPEPGEPGEPVEPPEPVTPPPQPVTPHDKPITNVAVVASGEILQTVGKQWILDNKIADGKKACNYGWHFHGATFGGSKFEASVSLPDVRVIQGVGTRHDRHHTDYSQTCVLASQEATYQGQQRQLSDLLTDPEASRLISHQGPLLITRQPGVAQLSPITGSSGASVSRADVEALPNSIAQREAILLDWTSQGLAEYAWSSITVGDLTYWVFADALSFGGVRINVSATLQQQIADLLSASLLTARMADLAFASASKVILPHTLPAGNEMSSTKFMVRESDLISSSALSA